MTKHLDPARSVVARLGGVAKVVEITNRHPSYVYRWMKAKTDGGRDGHIPNDDAKKLLEYGQEHGLLEPVDFFSADRLKAIPSQQVAS